MAVARSPRRQWLSGWHGDQRDMVSASVQAVAPMVSASAQTASALVLPAITTRASGLVSCGFLDGPLLVRRWDGDLPAGCRGVYTV
jgi:hypothetical protein